MDRLTNNSDLIVRRLHPGERKEIGNHLLRLDEDFRRTRFFATVSDCFIRDHAENIFNNNGLVCGAFLDGELRGVAELRQTSPGWPSIAEAAFSVETGWQSLGIGDALFDYLFAMAQNRGIGTIRMNCLNENTRMRHLATKHHARLKSGRDGIEADLRTFWPTAASLLKEILGETRGYMRAFFGKRRVDQSEGLVA